MQHKLQLNMHNNKQCKQYCTKNTHAYFVSLYKYLGIITIGKVLLETNIFDIYHNSIKFENWEN